MASLANLQVLDMLGSPESNQVEDVSALASLEKLVQLRLWNNKISDISPLANLPNVRTLWIINGNLLDEKSLSIVEQLKNKGVEIL